MARPRIHDEETSRRLLAAAGEIISTEGHAALSVRRVAEQVGTTTRAIYSAFGSKAGLVRAVYRTGFEEFDAMLRAVPETDRPLADLAGLARAYRASALARPYHYDVMFGVTTSGFTPEPDDLELSERSLGRLLHGVERCLDAGLWSGEARAITLQLWAVVHGLVGLERRGSLGDHDEATAIWNGALAAAGAGYSTAP